MINTAQFAKLAELRSRTDRDLMAVIDRELRAVRAHAINGGAERRLLAARTLLDLVEARGPEKRRLEREIAALLPPCALRAAS